jgi:hypothetical protein
MAKNFPDLLQGFHGDVAMFRRKVLKLIHLAGTVWFVACVGYIFVLGLRQAGVRWWVVFSLSGHGALVVFLLISLYLFAIYRGISSSQQVQIEHPLTSTPYYTMFYVTAPFLGGLAGCLGMIGINTTVSHFLSVVALGTLGTTFLVWVIVDPLAGLMEMLLPTTSRKHRAERLALARVQRQEKQREREHLLAEVLAKEESDVRHWRDVLRPQAEKLAGLLTSGEADFENAEREAVDIAVRAWQLGGITCMRTLRDMVMELTRQNRPDRAVIDYITVWWDGIGSWRSTSIHKAGGL